MFRFRLITPLVILMVLYQVNIITKSKLLFLFKNISRQLTPGGQLWATEM